MAVPFRKDRAQKVAREGIRSGWHRWGEARGSCKWSWVHPKWQRLAGSHRRQKSIWEVFRFGCNVERTELHADYRHDGSSPTRDMQWRDFYCRKSNRILGSVEKQRAWSSSLPERRSERTIKASGCVLLPGFVNGHHHMYQSLTHTIAISEGVERPAYNIDWNSETSDRWRHGSLQPPVRSR